MSLPGQLAAEAQAWREAWRGRRANPISLQAALESRRRAAQRPAWLPCSRFMFVCTALISSATAYLLVIAFLRFTAVAGSSVASRSFAHGALLWGCVQVLDSAVVLALLWLAERLALSFWYSGGLLAAYPGARGALGSEIAGSRITDYEYVVGALQHVTRLCWSPLLLLSGLSALDGFVYSWQLLSEQSTANAAASPPGQLAWLALLAVLTALLKPVCGLLAVWATVLVLLSFSPLWRSAAVTHIVVWLALAWHLPGLACVLPGTLGQYMTMYVGNVLPALFSESWVPLLVLLGLLALAVEAHTTSPLRAHQNWACQGVPAMRLILVSGALVVLCSGSGNLIAYMASSEIYPSTSDLPSWLLVFWPVLASSAASLMPLLSMPASVMMQASPQLDPGLGLRALAQAGLPLLLLLIFAGHARAAVYLRRSILG
jgi:hypothetical protein